MSDSSDSPVRPGTTVIQALCLLVFGALVAYVADYKLKLGVMPAGILGLSIFGVGLFAVLKLRGASSQMGVVFGLKFLSVTAYKILNFTVSMWLIRDLGFDDKAAGLIIMVWGVFMVLATIVSGPLTDVLGLRRTLFAGVVLCVVTRLVMALGPGPYVALVLGLLPLAVGEALCTPVLVAALRLFSKPSQRSVAFSLFYGLMNFGFMFGYFISDGVSAGMGGGATLTLPLWNQPVSTYGVLILSSMVIDLLMLPLIWLLKPGVRMTEHGLEPLPRQELAHPSGEGQGAVGAVKDAVAGTLQMLGKVFGSPGFGKLLVFLLMIGLLKVVFNLMDYVLNPFAERVIAADAVDKVGRLNATNSIMILVLAPLVGMLTRKYASYSMVILGGFITAFSFAFMALPASWFEAWADGWLGRVVGNGYLGIVGEVHPYFIMIFLWQVVFSIGEAFYSPRVYEYAASIAPPGQEASYSSLSYVPLLIGKLVTGAAFGGLLARYCPKDGPADPATMWLIIGLLVLVAPTGLLVLARAIRVPEEGRSAGR